MWCSYPALVMITPGDPTGVFLQNCYLLGGEKGKNIEGSIPRKGIWLGLNRESFFSMGYQKFEEDIFIRGEVLMEDIQEVMA